MTNETNQQHQHQGDPPQNGQDQQHGAAQQSQSAAGAVPKKAIPHPSEVHPSKHDSVMDLVAEQFGYTKTHEGHYGAEQGSVTVTPLSPGRDGVYFVRTHNPHVEAQPHGLDLSQS